MLKKVEQNIIFWMLIVIRGSLAHSLEAYYIASKINKIRDKHMKPTIRGRFRGTTCILESFSKSPRTPPVHEKSDPTESIIIQSRLDCPRTIILRINVGRI